MACPIATRAALGFAARLAENSTLLWSHHAILQSDENLAAGMERHPGGVQR